MIGKNIEYIMQALVSFLIGFLVSLAYQDYNSITFAKFNLVKFVNNSIYQGLFHNINLEQTLKSELTKIKNSKRKIYILSNYVAN